MHIIRILEGLDDRQHQQELDKTGFWGAQGAGCVIMAKDTGRFLIAHRSSMVEEPGTWGTWGGAIDSHEDPKQAAMREAREETGALFDASDVIPLFVFKAPSGSFRYSNFLVITDKEFRPRLDWENQGYKWVEFGDWPSPMHFGLKGLLNDKKSSEIMQKYSDMRSA